MTQTELDAMLHCRPRERNKRGFDKILLAAWLSCVIFFYVCFLWLYGKIRGKRVI
jgi:hypothetical protein